MGPSIPFRGGAEHPWGRKAWSPSKIRAYSSGSRVSPSSDYIFFSFNKLPSVEFSSLRITSHNMAFSLVQNFNLYPDRHLDLWVQSTCIIQQWYVYCGKYVDWKTGLQKLNSTVECTMSGNTNTERKEVEKKNFYIFNFRGFLEKKKIYFKEAFVYKRRNYSFRARSLTDWGD